MKGEEARIDTANRAALSRLYAVRPQWSGVSTAREAIGLPEYTLLHAGPPFARAGQPSPPVLSAAVLCCLYEGWAADEREAERLIHEGKVRLCPAQGFNVVTPLAAVISPSTSLVAIRDAREPARCVWSLLGSGIGPQLRFGGRDPAILQRLRWRDEQLAPALDNTLRSVPVGLFPLALSGLQRGDDLHASTAGANQALCRVLRPRLTEAPMTLIERTPLFFLTLWMGACHLMLSATVDPDDSHATVVIALAGNGQDCGIRIAGAARHWFTVPAAVPQGPSVEADSPGADSPETDSPDDRTVVSPMVGDSGVIDVAGFGAQAWAHRPALADPMRTWLPDPDAGCADWLVGVHPVFADLHLRTGLDAHRAARSAHPPRVAIARLDSGGKGLLGRGLCATPSALYTKVLQA